MSFLDGLLHRARVLVRPRAHERELAEELEFHLGLERMQREHAARGGLPPEDTRFAACRALGNVTYYREETRRAAGLGVLDDFRSDALFALRTLRHAPGFTAVAVLTLALGIGANTAIFSAVDAVLLRPLPFPDPQRLMLVNMTSPPVGDRLARDDIPWSYAKFAVMRDAQRVYSAVAAFLPTQFTVRVQDEALRESGEFIDSQYLPVLGIRPAFGRGFLAEDDHPGGPRVALLGHGLWERIFNSDSSVLGRALSVDGSPYTIVGVLPEGFSGLSGGAGFWIPLHAQPEASWQAPITTRDPQAHIYLAVGRLAPGVSIQQAKSAMRQIGMRVDAQFPPPRRANSVHLGATAVPLDMTRADVGTRRALFVLFGAVGLVLLIACANVANLCLVRSAGRRREIAVRLAIGAGRGRLVRQLVSESVVLAIVGGVASLLVAWVGVKSLSTLTITSVLRPATVFGLGTEQATGIQLNMTAFAFTGALAVTTGLLFGLVPAIQSTRFSVTSELKDDGATTLRHGGRLSGRNALVVAEIALAIVLLAGSGLMIRTLGELVAVRPGFDAEHLLTLRVNRAADWSRDSIARFFDVATERLAALPGVKAVGLGECPPLSRGCYPRALVAPADRAVDSPGAFGIHWITPGWSDALGVPVVRGRSFARSDDATARRVVLVNETMAKRLWPNEDPVGRPVRVGVFREGADTAFVVGVMRDLRFGSLDSLPEPELYVSFYQVPLTYRMMIFVRTTGDPTTAAEATRRALREVAPGFPVYDMMPMAARVADATARPRFLAFLLAIFAATALFLAVIGTYGVISFAVAQRTKEIGVRVALGATTADILKLVVGHGMSLAMIGILFGLTGALAATRVLRSMLYGVEPTDPVTLSCIVGVLVMAVVMASWIPARRAAGVPAVWALRGR